MDERSFVCRCVLVSYLNNQRERKPHLISASDSRASNCALTLDPTDPCRVSSQISNHQLSANSHLENIVSCNSETARIRMSNLLLVGFVLIVITKNAKTHRERFSLHGVVAAKTGQNRDPAQSAWFCYQY